MPDRFPPGIAVAVRHFNAGRFFEAHEAFEALLDEVETDDRWDLLVALIQVAVGYHKRSANHPGADRMLHLGVGKLARFPSVAYGIDLDALRRRVADDLAGVPTDSPPRIDMRAPHGPG
jgi:predicted metal-dependent hydrolase